MTGQRKKVEEKMLILTTLTENNLLNFVCNLRVFKQKQEDIRARLDCMSHAFYGHVLIYNICIITIIYACP